MARTGLQLLLLAALISLVGGAVSRAQTVADRTPAEERTFAVPNFRHVDPTAPAPDLRQIKAIRFLTDDDFPPFSYAGSGGELAGFNIDLVQAMCTELRLECQFVPTPWEELIPALGRGDGDAILAGIRISEETLEVLDFSRPYYRSLARFAVRAGTALTDADLRSLAGKRVGVMAGTAHEAFLKTYFGRSNIRPFTDATAAREALRTGRIDALFDDAARQMFWLAGRDSRDCCEFAAGAFLDVGYFSRPMAIAVKRGDDRLREVLDHGLDRLQTSGAFANAFRRYFPMSPW